MKSLIVIVIGFVISWHYTDISSDAILASVVAPLAVFIFLVSLAIWFVLMFHHKDINQNVSGGTGIDGMGGDGSDC